MSSKFYLPSGSASSISTPPYRPSISGDEEEEDDLPYPAELQRSDFLSSDFQPSTYLSTLRNRHQTLEDLRSDLRSRSQLLNQELMDLVNSNYEEFLSLGGDLRGGEEKVEGVRVGLLAFQREIMGIQKAVQARAAEVDALLSERKEIRTEVVLGRTLLELNEQIDELERDLGITGSGRSYSDDEDEDELEDELDDDASESASGPQDPASALLARRLQRHTQRYLLIVQIMARTPPEHPFLLAQRPRVEALRRTLLLDLGTALRQAKAKASSEATLKLLHLYHALDATAESIKVLKNS